MKENRIKKALSLLLAVIILAVGLPFAAAIPAKAEDGSFTEGYYTYTVENGEATIIDCDKGISGDVVIPSELGGYPVTEIGDWAFEDCTGLTSITIPDSVISISYQSFYACKNLKSIIIPEGVANIGDEAFEHCSKLSDISISDRATSIGDYAFYNTAWYNSQPSGITYIGKVLYKYKGTMSENTSIVIPEGIKGIADSAFRDCHGLTSITIGNSVTNIGKQAFEGCTGLTSITMPDSVTSIDWRAFYRCDKLSSVTVGNSVTNIEFAAFNNCPNLTEINVDSGNSVYHSKNNCIIKTTSKELVIGCKTSKIPSDGSVISIGQETFSDCKGLTNITIPGSITSIGDSAFSNCTSLTSVTIPDSVTSIGWAAFYGCTGLTGVTIGNSVTSIGDFAFFGCTGLTSVTIPDSVTSIDDSAFHGCTGLTSITIPDSVTSIGECAFFDCTGLTSVTIGNSVISIGSYVFYGCTGLKSVTIPDSVTSIDYCAFYGCTNLTSVTIPNSVTNIDGKAFGYTDYGERVENFTIYGYTGTAAETYANENGFTFIPLEDDENEVKDESTGISIIYPDNAYSNDIQLNVTVVTSGSAFNVLNAEKGNFKKSLFDISTTINGEKVQPNGSVFVKIPLPEECNAEKTYVYYVTNDGKLERIPSRIEDGYIIFETTHFSFYAIVDETEKEEPVNPPKPENPSNNCSCICHKGGISAFFYKIARFFWKLFKIKRTCACNAAHY